MRALHRSATRATGARTTLRRLLAFVAVAATAAALSVTSAPLAAAEPVLDKPTLQTVTFTSTASVASWTVPGSASETAQLMISAVGGQGGRGGSDGSWAPAQGGYVGVVSGTISVPGGTTLQIAVGAGGGKGADGSSSVPGVAGATGGANTFGGYGGGQGGQTGFAGYSGAGGGGGAATVIKVAGSSIVAGGAGGGGGSGNGDVLRGRAAEATFSADHASGNTNGGAGQSVPNPSDKPEDGGGAGGGGGGATGGAGGAIEYGSGATTEWFGYGGYPGANAAGGYGTLEGSYQYYSGNGANGSVTIQYVDGPPAPARNVVGRAGSAAGSVELTWQAPVNSGQTAVTAYRVQYSADGGATWSDATLAGAATVTADGGAATVTGLDGGTEYTFRVAAQNGYAGNGGWGGWSVPSAPVTAAAGGGVVLDPWGGSGADAGGTGAENAHVVPGDGTITVTWDPGTAPAEYTMHVYDAAGNEAGDSPRSCGGGDCTVSGLDPDGDYTVVIETPGVETSKSDDVPPYQDDPNVHGTSGGWNGAEVTRNSGGTSITVDWPAPATAPTEPYHLHVYENDVELSAPFSPVSCNAGSPCTASGLEPGTTYQVAMDVPVPGAGEGDAPTEGPLTDKVTVPGYTSPPSNTHPGPDGTITRNQDGTITVTPSPLPDEPYLLHIYDEDGEIENSPVQCQAGSACTTGYLDPATTYQVAVEVPNRSDASEPVTPTTDQTWTDPQDPTRVLTGPPTNLGAAARDRALGVSFTAPTPQPAGNAILYYQYSVDGGSTWTNSGAIASPANVSGLTNGTQYSVMLRAMTLQGEGVASGAVTGTPRGYPSAPYSGGNPAGISAEKSGSTVTVSWAPYHANGSAVTSYTVTAFNAASAGSSVKTCTVGGSTYTCQLTGVNGKVYLSVQAQNGVGASPRSDPRIALDMDATIPGAPGKPVAGGSLSWTTPSGVTGDTAYTVQYSTDGGASWTTTIPSSGPTTSGATVTAGLSSLAGGGNYVFRVRAQNGALVGPWSDSSDPIAVTAPVTPAFGSVTRTPGGFTVQVTNYDAALTWAVSASPGTATINSDGLVTVTGLSASQPATVTATATGFGTGGRSASTSGTALGGTAPVLSAATPTSGGFTVTIVNWSEYKNGRYGPHTVFTPVPAPVGGVPQYSGPDATGVITVSGLGDGATLSFALKVKSDTHTETTSQPVSGTSLLAAVTPTFGAVTSTSDGFTVKLTNFDTNGNTSYTVTVDHGAVAGPDASGTITVSGLDAGTSATVTVKAQKDGHAIGTGTKSGTALAAGGAPVFGAVVRASGGFTTSVTIPGGYSGATLSILVSGGATVACGANSKVNGPVTCTDGQTITVAGVASGKTATVTAYLWDDAHGVASADVTGQALFAGVAPEFGPTYRAEGAVGFPITNWTVFTGSDAANGTDPHRTAGYRSSQTTVQVQIAGTGAWTACDAAPFNGDLSALSSMTAPDIRCATNGEVGVGGLADGQSVTVEVQVSDATTNHTDTTVNRVGVAPTAEELTKLINLTPTTDGFTVDIEGYPATDTTYTVSLLEPTSGAGVPAGAAVQCGAAGASGQTQVTCQDPQIIVTGLDPGQSVKVQVSATVPGPNTPADDTVTVTEVTGTALRDDLALAFGDVTRTAGGFEFTISDSTYDPTGATSYALTLTDVSGSPIPGAQVSRNGKYITVSGLADGQSATVKVVAQRDGYQPAVLTADAAAQDAGVAFTLSGVTRTAYGFEVHVADQSVFSGYDGASTKAIVMVSGGASVQCGVSGQARVNGPVACALTDTVIVSGVASGQLATVTVAVSDKNHVETAATATGQARFAGVAPEFGEVTRTADGFTTSISNWDTFKDLSLTVSGTNAYVAANTTVAAAVAGISGSAPVISGPDGSGQITVTGLTSEQQAKVTATVSESDGNHTDSFASRVGQALATGVQPTFTDGTSLVKSFTVKIANYDAAASYTITATEGTGSAGAAIPAKNVSFNATTKVVTVTGLTDGAAATVHVHVAAAGKLPADASHLGAALKAPITPVLAVVSNNASGFTVRIVNKAAFDTYGSGTTFVPAATPQSGDGPPTVTDNHDGTYVVTGVPTGRTATLTVTVKQAEHPDAVSDAVTGTALYAGVAPILGSPTRTATGFTVPITNYVLYTAAGAPTVDGDGGSRYGDAGQFAITVTAVSAGGTALGDVKAVVLQPDGVLQIGGLVYGQTASVKLAAGDGLTRHQDATSEPIEGQALYAPIKASFGQTTATLDSITVRITNFDSDANYAISSSAGVASRSGSVITVTGLTPGQSATITVAATSPGHVQGLSSVSGTALKVADQPGSSPATQLEDGFSAKITPFDKDANYTAAVSGAPGATVSISGDTVTVTGMKPGDTVTVTITQTKDGFAPITTTITYTLPLDKGSDDDPSGGATPPAASELKPGQTAVTVNGVSVPSKTTFGPNGVTVTWQGMTMTAVRIDDGRPVPPGAGGTPVGLLTVPFTGSVKVDVSGFAPGSRVQLWAFSTPTLLGTFTSQPNARGIITVDLPAAVIVGDHTLVASGANRAGEHVTMATAMRVTPLTGEAGVPGSPGSSGEAGVPDPDATDGRGEIAYTGTRTFDELRIAAALLVAGMGLIGLTYRRRRTDPALAQIAVAGGFGPEPDSTGPMVVAYGTWKRSPDSSAAAAAVSAAMTAVPSTGYAVSAGTAGSQIGAAPTSSAWTAAAVPSGQPGYRFIPPRTAPSAEWIGLRFSLGLIEA